MKRRMLSALLWFFACWYGAALLANFLGIHPMLGPILGTAAAALFAGDPGRVVWGRNATNATQPTPEGELA
jgi:hypothetical protein